MLIGASTLVFGYEHGRQLRSYLEHLLPHGVKWSLHQTDVEDAVTTTRLRIEHGVSHLPPLLTCSGEKYNVNKLPIYPANKEPFLNQLTCVILDRNWYRSTSTCLHV